jgi:hypothetical protein
VTETLSDKNPDMLVAQRNSDTPLNPFRRLSLLWNHQCTMAVPTASCLLTNVTRSIIRNLSLCLLSGCNHHEKLMSVLPMSLGICLVKEEEINHCAAPDNVRACCTEVHSGRRRRGLLLHLPRGLVSTLPAFTCVW